MNISVFFETSMICMEKDISNNDNSNLKLKELLKKFENNTGVCYFRFLFNMLLEIFRKTKNKEDLLTSEEIEKLIIKVESYINSNKEKIFENIFLLIKNLNNKLEIFKKSNIIGVYLMKNTLSEEYNEYIRIAKIKESDMYGIKKDLKDKIMHNESFDYNKTMNNVLASDVAKDKQSVTIYNFINFVKIVCGLSFSKSPNIEKIVNDINTQFAIGGDGNQDTIIFFHFLIENIIKPIFIKNKEDPFNAKILNIINQIKFPNIFRNNFLDFSKNNKEFINLNPMNNSKYSKYFMEEILVLKDQFNKNVNEQRLERFFLLFKGMRNFSITNIDHIYPITIKGNKIIYTNDDIYKEFSSFNDLFDFFSYETIRAILLTIKNGCLNISMTQKYIDYFSLKKYINNRLVKNLISNDFIINKEEQKNQDKIIKAYKKLDAIYYIQSTSSHHIDNGFQGKKNEINMNIDNCFKNQKNAINIFLEEIPGYNPFKTLISKFLTQKNIKMKNLLKEYNTVKNANDARKQKNIEKNMENLVDIHNTFRSLLEDILKNPHLYMKYIDEVASFAQYMTIKYAAKNLWCYEEIKRDFLIFMSDIYYTNGLQVEYNENKSYSDKYKNDLESLKQFLKSLNEKQDKNKINKKIKIENKKSQPIDLDDLLINRFEKNLNNYLEQQTIEKYSNEFNLKNKKQPKVQSYYNKYEKDKF
jgi:hypothetical protein